MHGPQEGLLELTDVPLKNSQTVKLSCRQPCRRQWDVEKEKGKFFIATLKYATGFPCFLLSLSPTHALFFLGFPPLVMKLRSERTSCMTALLLK